ncbi:uncharacterized protein EV422DRAFT_517270 [Fimicolochytrium jonesii]|uniref:uncharacterized protein n=1 Tax=Fimicolochytrium jonesii TaxID=1396493 RepID=UPI0022FF4229|nr:uncharacterized protein EV422DRAFT_517270 [Fimicolochytrium jonesii]KAI8825053.1 hypothetical protein EV422DRAFT_517270 [Fimicolochytrium jonesii]
MTSYNEAVLTQKLAKLVDTQDSITVLSQWLMFHRKHAASSVQTWARELHKAPPHRKLSFVYLANDVVQNSRRKGDEFVVEFAKVFPETLPHAYRHTGQDTRHKITRILTILEERQIFSKDFVRDVKQRMENPAASSNTTAPTIPPDAVAIVKHLNSLHKLADAKQKLAEATSAAANPAAENPEQMVETLDRYRDALVRDINERKTLIGVLNALAEKMALFLKGDEISLEQCTRQIKTKGNIPQAPASEVVIPSSREEPMTDLPHPPDPASNAASHEENVEEYDPTNYTIPTPLPTFTDASAEAASNPPTQSPIPPSDLIEAILGDQQPPSAGAIGDAQAMFDLLPPELIEQLRQQGPGPMLGTAAAEQTATDILRTLEALRSGAMQ